MAPWLTGRTVRGVVRVDAPEGPKTAHLERAVGQRIERVDRRGKFLVLPLRAPGAARPADELVLHLGMTGVLGPRRPEAHLRLVLQLDGPAPDALYVQDARRFGRWLVLPDGDRASLPTLAAMGPEPLEDGFTVAGFAAALARSHAPVKALLLSQRPVSGVGNIYADEALWWARVHPLTPAADVPRVKVRALHGAIRDVLAAAVEAQGTTLYDYRTVNGEVGAYLEQLAAYGHDGDACPRCGATIVKLVVAQRGTHVCPRCQRAPRGAGAVPRGRSHRRAPVAGAPSGVAR
ncbi:MAG: bifunctional DNA-formamidopyrimidine glycosylase/DNA-(apurinic or apyrimidinic site) lyase [Trueperaceae bacterium]|nr:bifunctional DNA-formamidopyrimidine glycosylase/DNA-(apurinic or apyrimidinic site) lyase [Trueperaceae bacterium]